jgi:hypothetical protein
MMRTIHCDGELRGIMGKVDDNQDVDMNFTKDRTMYLKQSGIIERSKKGSEPHTIAFHV